MYIAPHQDPYLETLPTQAKAKRTEAGGIENRYRLGGALDLREGGERIILIRQFT